MNFRGDGRGRGRVEATLELTPLIDIIFLLLIFFVMTTTPAMNVVERLDVDLPGAASGDALDLDEQLRVVVKVHSDGRIMLRHGEEGDEELVRDLSAAMTEVYQEHPGATIWIQGDVEASHGSVIELLDITRQVGFGRVHMAVSPDG